MDKTVNHIGCPHCKYIERPAAAGLLNLSLSLSLFTVLAVNRASPPPPKRFALHLCDDGAQLGVYFLPDQTMLPHSGGHVEVVGLIFNVYPRAI